MPSYPSGLDSWIKMQICDTHDHCCESQEMSGIPRGGYKSFLAEDPCSDIILLNKDHPNEDGQLVRVQHSGPDGTEINHINIHLNDDTFLKCKSLLPDNAGRIVDLDCDAVYVIR